MRPTYQATSHHAAAAACDLNAPAPLGVTHHTNERARETNTTAPPCPLATHSTRGMGRAIAHGAFFCLGSLSSSCRRWCVWVFYRRAKRRQAPWWEINTPGTRIWFLCSIRDLPWADPPLPGTKGPKWRAGDRRRVGQFAGLGLLWSTPGWSFNHVHHRGLSSRRCRGKWVLVTSRANFVIFQVRCFPRG